MSQQARAWAPAQTGTHEDDQLSEVRTQVIPLRAIKGNRGNVSPSTSNDQDARFANQDRRIKEQIERNRVVLDERLENVVRHARKRFHGLDAEITTLKTDRDRMVNDLRYLGNNWMPGVEQRIARLQTTVADLTGQLHDVRARQYTAGLTAPASVAAPKQRTSKKPLSGFYPLVIAAAMILFGIAVLIAQHGF